MSDGLATHAVDHRALLEPMFTIHAEEPALVRLSGELDMAVAPTLATALAPHLKRGGRVAIDLTELTFMDSSGINVLCRAAGQLGDRGRIVLYHPRPIVRRILDMTGLIGIIGINDQPPST
jgi:anti-anti-sigma factor